MLQYLSPDGRVRVERLGLAVGQPSVSVSQKDDSLYKKWWFWTAIGAGAAGLGVGSYFLFKPEDTLRFSVQKQ
jgi:hypothetical protein